VIAHALRVLLGAIIPRKIVKNGTIDLLSFLSFTTPTLFDIRFLRFFCVVLWLKKASFVREQPKQARQNLCVRLSELFFFFRRFCFFFQFGN